MFYQVDCKSFEQFEIEINLWLEDHQNIDIISTNRTANSYIILYKESDVGNDSNEVD
jgi:hypothetical protein